MTEVFIKYNPYTVTTVFEINGEEMDKNSEFYLKQDNVRLQEWIEPMGQQWEGFYKELYDYQNSSEPIRIIFKGTIMDFEDLKDAYNKDKENIKFKSVDFEYIENQNKNNKLEVLKDKFQELENGPIDDLRDPKIRESFEKALSSEFEVVVMAPMSSGKSTLINAILGVDLLPAYNEATTATITRIKDIDGSDEFTVSCAFSDGQQFVDNEPATTQLIDELNRTADKEKNIDCINIQGDIPNIPSDKVNIVFVDTPGGNNSQDRKHKEVMKRAINDENKGMILFVFNYTQLGTDDCDAILSMAASAIRNSTTGKQARDRFIFVCNKMDAQDPEKEPYENALESVKKHLKEKGIEEPNLFLTCADLCKLIRMERSGEEMSESDEDRLDGYLRPFNRKTRRLFQYASIPETKKAEYEQIVEEIAETGEKRSHEVAEINSGIPALEDAIKLYIEKYAEAIKIKTLHDAFMKRVEELDMKAKSEQKWASSTQEYENMRKELEEKKIAFEEDKNRQIFKKKIDAIEADYSKVYEVVDEMTQRLTDITAQYDLKEELEYEDAKEQYDSLAKEVMELGKKTQDKLELAFDEGVYKECKAIFEKYQQYIKEIDRKGLLNIGDYNFKKTEEFSTLNKFESQVGHIINSDNTYSENESYIHEREEHYKVKKSGIFSAIKRFLGFSGGWLEKTKKKTMVEIKSLIKDAIANTILAIQENVDEEVKCAKTRERRLKDDARAKLDNIDDMVRNEYEKIQETTKNQEELKAKVEKNKKDMEWLEQFINEMATLLEV